MVAENSRYLGPTAVHRRVYRKRPISRLLNHLMKFFESWTFVLHHEPHATPCHHLIRDLDSLLYLINLLSKII